MTTVRYFGVYMYIKSIVIEVYRRNSGSYAQKYITDMIIHKYYIKFSAIQFSSLILI
jgi:hypothetical protein